MYSPCMGNSHTPGRKQPSCLLMMLILVCLGIATHHAASRMINTIADIDVSEYIESRGEMIHTMRGDIEIMLGLQSVIKTML